MRAAVGLSVIFGVGFGLLIEQRLEVARWGSCTAMQVTSKDTRTAVQIRKDLENDVHVSSMRYR